MKLQKGWNRWEKPGDIATHPVASYSNTSKSNSSSSRYLETVSYTHLDVYKRQIYRCDVQTYNFSGRNNTNFQRKIENL